MADLPAADGFVTTAAHPGRPEVLTAWMDATVIAENDSLATDPDLDRFDERNDPPYPPEFLAVTVRRRLRATIPSPTRPRRSSNVFALPASQTARSP